MSSANSLSLVADFLSYSAFSFSAFISEQILLHLSGRSLPCIMRIATSGAVMAFRCIILWLCTFLKLRHSHYVFYYRRTPTLDGFTPFLFWTFDYLFWLFDYSFWLFDYRVKYSKFLLAVETWFRLLETIFVTPYKVLDMANNQMLISNIWIFRTIIAWLKFLYRQSVWFPASFPCLSFPAPFFVHCPYKGRINRAESVLTGLKPY